jgi:hypothetical protein
MKRIEFQIDDGLYKDLERKRGSMSKGAYIRYLIDEGEDMRDVVELKDTIVSPTKTPLYKGKATANRPKSLEEEMLGA